MSLTEEIGSMLEPYLEDGRFFVVSLTVKPVRSAHHITVLVDSDEGVTIEQCASISRRLAHQIETREMFGDAYNIEVSSPGVDQPLVLPRQYRKNVGRELKIQLKDGSTVTGKLTGIGEDEVLTIELPRPKKKPKAGEPEPELSKTIPLSEVTKTVVQISFK